MKDYFRSSIIKAQITRQIPKTRFRPTIYSLYQFQGNTNINLNSSTENQLNPNESEINIPNERNQNYASNGLDRMEKMVILLIK